MKKLSRILSLLMVVVLAAALCACGGSSSGGAAPAGEAKSEAPAAQAQSEAPAAQAQSEAPAAEEAQPEAPAAEEAQPEAPAAAADAKPVELVFSHYEPVASSQAGGLEAWAEAVENASGGSVKIEIMGGGALGAEPDCIELVKNGAADITMSTPSLFNNMFPYIQIMQTPMLGVPNSTVGTNTVWDLYEKYTEQYDAMFADLGLKVLMLFTTPSSVIGTKIPVHNVSDLKGLRLRASAGMLSDMVSAWGATPVTLGQSEIYESMEKNAIDGHLNVWSAMAPFKFYEVGKYAMSIDVNVNVLFVVMGLNQWNSLSPEQQEAINSVSLRQGSFDYLVSAMEANADSSISLCEENGVEIYYPTEEEIAEFAAPVPDVINGWLEENSSDRMDMFELYEAAKETIASYE